jgi:hypothetical protein
MELGGKLLGCADEFFWIGIEGAGGGEDFCSVFAVKPAFNCEAMLLIPKGVEDGSS